MNAFQQLIGSVSLALLAALAPDIAQAAKSDYGIDLVTDGVLVERFADAKKTSAPLRDDQRSAKLGDVMQIITNTRDINWLIRELGAPDNIEDLGNGHAEWQWFQDKNVATSKNYIVSKHLRCTQIFYVDDKGKINGWDHSGCSTVTRNSGRVQPLKTHYGTMRYTTPMAVPNGDSLKRARSFLDVIYLNLGESKDGMIARFGKPTRTASAGGGKSQLTWRREWNTYHHEVDGYEWACYGFMCSSWNTYTTIATPRACEWSLTTDATNRVVGWNLSDCDEWARTASAEANGGYISTLIPAPELNYQATPKVVESALLARKAHASSQRIKTRSDNSEQWMGRYDVFWLKNNQRKPDQLDDLGQGYKRWVWNDRKLSCQQEFYTDTKGDIVGWNHNCPEGNFGIMPVATPIPTPKIPVVAARRAP